MVAETKAQLIEAFGGFNALVNNFQVNDIVFPQLFESSLVQTQVVEREIINQQQRLATVQVAAIGRINKAKEEVQRLRNESAARIVKLDASIKADIASQETACSD